MSRLYAECDNLLDAIQIALEQINNSILWDTGDFDGAIIQLETVSQSLAWVQPLFEDSANFMSLMSTVTDMISYLMDSHDRCYRNNTTGRPLNISKVQLSALLELEFTQVEIAKIFGCSSKTIHRRVLQFGLDQFTSYSAISDEKLDEVVLNFVSNFPTSGQKQLAGHLTSLGYRIQRYRI